MDGLNWTDYAIAICTIVTTVTTILGAVFVVIQIRNGTKAQQDKKAPLLVLERENDSMAGIIVKNVGELSAIIVKLSAKVFYVDGSCDEKELMQQIVIEKGATQGVFSLSRELAINTDKITRAVITIKYKSPLYDRTRKSSAEFIRR